MCDNKYEDLVHFILHCPAYSEKKEPSPSTTILKKDDQVLGSLFFTNAIEDFEVFKRTLFNFWKIGTMKRKEIGT